jgi:hypothetical protein
MLNSTKSKLQAAKKHFLLQDCWKKSFPTVSLPGKKEGKYDTLCNSDSLYQTRSAAFPVGECMDFND